MIKIRRSIGWFMKFTSLFPDALNLSFSQHVGLLLSGTVWLCASRRLLATTSVFFINNHTSWLLLLILVLLSDRCFGNLENEVEVLCLLHGIWLMNVLLLLVLFFIIALPSAWSCVQDVTGTLDNLESFLLEKYRVVDPCVYDMS